MEASNTLFFLVASAICLLGLVGLALALFLIAPQHSGQGLGGAVLAIFMVTSSVVAMIKRVQRQG